MKNILSRTKTAFILLVVTVISIACYAYMFARPISYGMNYYNETVYENQNFEGVIRFYPDGTMINRNSNYNKDLESRYYYKKGYVFFTQARTDEAYEEEVAYINENFEEALTVPFYSFKINAFREVGEGLEGYRSVYTCKKAVSLAIIGGVVELMLIGFTCASFILRKKTES